MSSEIKRTGSPGKADSQNGSEPAMLEGKLVKVEGKKLIIASPEGQETTLILANEVKLTCDGNTCNSSDLHAGSRIRVTTKKGDRNMATCVESLEKEGEFAKCN
jgi:hypothetical protein